MYATQLQKSCNTFQDEDDKINNKEIVLKYKDVNKEGVLCHITKNNSKSNNMTNKINTKKDKSKYNQELDIMENKEI